MVERVLGWRVDFRGTEMLMFDAPKESALWLRENDHLIRQEYPNMGAFEAVTKFLGEHFRGFGYQAPPSYDRLVGPQEIETILCKHKSHRNGHYPVGKDWREVRAALSNWSNHSPTAAQLLELCRT
jgi:hypothetical protein